MACVLKAVSCISWNEHRSVGSDMVLFALDSQCAFPGQNIIHFRRCMSMTLESVSGTNFCHTCSQRLGRCMFIAE